MGSSSGISISVVLQQHQQPQHEDEGRKTVREREVRDERRNRGPGKGMESMDLGSGRGGELGCFVA